MGKLHASDPILLLAVQLFPNYDTLETGLIRYMNNLFVLRTVRNMIPAIESGHAEDVLDSAIKLIETLESNHIDRFRMHLTCIRFFTSNFDLPQFQADFQVYTRLV